MEELRKEATHLAGALTALLDEIDHDLERLSCEEVTAANQVESLSKKVNATISKARRKLRDLQFVSEEAHEDELFQELCRVVSEGKRRLEACRERCATVFLEAGNKVRRNVEKEEREMLLGGASPSDRQAKQNSGDELQTAESITASLQRTRQLLTRQVDHSESTLGIMSESQDTLSKVNNEYKDHSGFLRTGKKLLNSLEKQELWERRLFYGCFGLFVAVVLYIVLKRFAFFSPIHLLPKGQSPKTADSVDHADGLSNDNHHVDDYIQIERTAQKENHMPNPHKGMSQEDLVDNKAEDHSKEDHQQHTQGGSGGVLSNAEEANHYENDKVKIEAGKTEL